MVDASSIYWFDNDGELMEIVIDEDGQWSLVDTPAEGELSEQDAQNICNARDLVNHCFKRDVSSENEPEILRFPNF
jgi:RIO-like serine/threonine protein kinase